MRIGFLTPGWPPGAYPNGIVTYLGHLREGLASLGHEAFFLCIDPSCSAPDISLVDPVHYSLIDRVRSRFQFEDVFFRLFAQTIANSARRFAEQHRIDVLQMEETHGFAGVVSDALAPAVSVTMRLHGSWFLVGPHSGAEKTKPENAHRVEREGAALARVAAVTSPSQSALDAAARRYGAIRPPHKAIPNPISPVPPALRWARQARQDKRILFVGRFDAIKGADIVLKAFERVVAACPNCTLDFVGPDTGLVEPDGTQVHFDAFRQRLSAQAQARITYWGARPMADIASLRRDTDVAIVASRFESFSNVTLESLAAGCPVVATAVGGIPEIVTHHRNGLLVPSENAEALADAIVEIINAPDLAERLSQEALVDCATRFSPVTTAGQTVAFYSDVLAARRSRSEGLTQDRQSARGAAPAAR